MPSIAEQIVKSVQKHRKNQEDVKIMKDGVIACPRLSTGCAVIDKMLGGGIPIGRVIEVYGDEGCGKTTLALHLLMAAQKSGGVGVMIDVEHALDVKYAANIGVDCDELIMSQPDSGEDALEIAVDLMETKASLNDEGTLLIIVDSAAALASRAELDGDIGDVNQYAPVARLLSSSLRRLKGTVRKTHSVLVFTNQMRDTIGVWGKPSQSTGGRALKFYSSVRLELQMGAKIRDNRTIIGQTVRARVAKNKTYPPFREGEFNIYWGTGIDLVHSLFLVGVENKIIKQTGGWFRLGKRKVQGERKFVDLMREDESIVEFIQERVNNGQQ